MNCRSVTGALAFTAVLMMAGCGPTSQSSTASTPTATAAASTTAGSASPSVAVPSQAAGFNGHYRGSWTNTTYGSTGSADSTVAIDLTTGVATSTLKLGGNVFGSAAPPEETFTGRVTAQGATFTGTSPTFGAYTITITPAGSYTMHCPQVPGGRVATFDVTGTVTPAAFDFTYTVTFVAGGSPAHGTAHLAKS